MESSPPSPSPYEYGDGDKRKGEAKDDKPSPPIRVPLPASEVHASEPQRPERIIPLFQNFVEKEAEAEEHKKKDKDKADKPAEQVETVQSEVEKPAEVPAAPVDTEHKIAPEDVADLEHDLWEEFNNTPPAAIETDLPAAAGNTATLEKPAEVTRKEHEPAAELNIPEAAEHDEAATDKEFFDIANAMDPEGEFMAGQKELEKNDTKEQPQHLVWHETDTVHVNAPPPPKIEAAPEPTPVSAEQSEDSIASGPSAEAMAVEIAATEPDDPGSVEALDALYAAPAAEVAQDHPEAYGGSLPPPTEQEQFNQIMQSADMGEPFEQATSDAPVIAEERIQQTAEETVDEPVTAAQPAVQPLGYYRGPTAGGGIPTPDGAPSPFPGGETGPTSPADNDPYGQQWYPPKHYGSRSGFGPASLAGKAVEAAALTTMMGGAGAAHAVEAGIAGAVAGGVVGGVAGYEAGKHAAKRQTGELRQEVERQDQHITALTNEQQLHQQESERRDQHLTTLTNEQRVTHEQVEHLTQSNQHLVAEQQKTAAAEAAAVSAATAVASERVTANNSDEKVVRSEWVDMVVDKRTGRLAEGENVNNFGAELEAEQRHNIAPPDPIGDALAAAQAAAQASSDVSNYEQVPEPMQGSNSMLGSGQLGFTHELPAGYGDGGQVDSNHRLEAARNPVATALASPLLWAGVVVLVLAFFAAAFL
ncbi:MAG TPA: hypothetical protein VGO07_07210 [Candidatus Saccharimonadales bacterium]|jgi:hypothetical protein|nr:hypothetical protein [Candidatus Saccharimonadales bacterium]